MLPSQLSSGDVIADRRADYAKMLAESGEPASAAELMEQALELAPRWAAGWFTLATYREKAGDASGAIAALNEVLMLDQGDVFGARLKLAVLGGADVPDRPPSLYVERLFDDYADRFETSLVEKLGYSVPGKLAGLIAETAGIPKHFRLAIDLGCGTGLLGPEIRARVDRLEGYDLSKGMLAKAAEKNVYDHLGQADLALEPELSGIFGGELEAGRADLITAADVLMYLGDLHGVTAIVQKLSADGAVFAFSVEDAQQADGYVLRDSLRFAHSEAYVRKVLAAHGFTVLDLTRGVIRMDGGKPVHGILFITRKSA
ncbi:MULTISPECIES: methyltransferase domain-containing protein [unclassified Rhizobium]|uniref:methyltransferase domain-containing protein n=1 Tax=Rhizobium TaxID=379 RepID=UPI00084C19C8|nr:MULTISPECIES: methyltransferase domain-containing protein [unclassified Rhizobium]OED00349.1 methyltransferase [Rhizobium sp. YK2]QYA12920.1 methyltransferase domain-containing protein [Rhizobium sp. AB2/73]UEQ81147.1 methyltransferase domain-containing protein [Rhizobium sp. AB2/73]